MDWLQTADSDDVLVVAIHARLILTRRLRAASLRGDSQLVDRLLPDVERIFTPLDHL